MCCPTLTARSTKLPDCLIMKAVLLCKKIRGAHEKGMRTGIPCKVLISFTERLKEKYQRDFEKSA